jgi:hypothetical protein
VGSVEGEGSVIQTFLRGGDYNLLKKI